jgi:hypothetical protein
LIAAINDDQLLSRSEMLLFSSLDAWRPILARFVL